MRRHVLVFSVVGLALAGTAGAAVQKGDTEAGVLGGWLSGDGGNHGVDFDAWFLSGRLGRFLTDNIEISGVVVAMHQKEQWAASETGFESLPGSVKHESEVFALGAQFAYHFMPTNRWVPYVGVQLFWANAEVKEDYPTEDVYDWSRDEDGCLYGPILGFRLELAANSDFFVEYQYHRWGGGVEDLLGKDGHGLFLGIVYQFD